MLIACKTNYFKVYCTSRHQQLLNLSCQSHLYECQEPLDDLVIVGRKQVCIFLNALNERSLVAVEAEAALTASYLTVVDWKKWLLSNELHLISEH